MADDGFVRLVWDFLLIGFEVDFVDCAFVGRNFAGVVADRVASGRAGVSVVDDVWDRVDGGFVVDSLDDDFFVWVVVRDFVFATGAGEVVSVFGLERLIPVIFCAVIPEFGVDFADFSFEDFAGAGCEF